MELPKLWRWFPIDDEARCPSWEVPIDKLRPACNGQRRSLSAAGTSVGSWVMGKSVLVLAR